MGDEAEVVQCPFKIRRFIYQEPSQLTFRQTSNHQIKSIYHTLPIYFFRILLCLLVTQCIKLNLELPCLLALPLVPAEISAHNQQPTCGHHVDQYSRK